MVLLFGVVEVVGPEKLMRGEFVIKFIVCPARELIQGVVVVAEQGALQTTPAHQLNAAK